MESGSPVLENSRASSVPKDFPAVVGTSKKKKKKNKSPTDCKIKSQNKEDTEIFDSENHLAVPQAVVSSVDEEEMDAEVSKWRGKISGKEGWISLGPWPKRSGSVWSVRAYNPEGPMMWITIHYEDVIEKITFESKNYKGATIGSPVHIGDVRAEASKATKKKFCIDSSIEQFSFICLTYEESYKYNGYTDAAITSLYFETNIGKKYGPFGSRTGPSSVSLPVQGGVITGFHGIGVCGIGVFVAPKANSLPSSGKKEDILHPIQDPNSAPVQCEDQIINEEELISFGPWGGKNGKDWAFKASGPLLQMSICYGEVINSILFQSRSCDGFVTGSSLKIGGSGGHMTETICIDSSIEQLWSIKLMYGDYNGEVAIFSIFFCTNLKKYGPFGLGSGASSISIPMLGGLLVGFHGRGGTYLTAIGMIVTPKVNGMPSSAESFYNMRSIIDPDYAPTQLKSKISDEEGLKSLGPWGYGGNNYWASKVNAPIMRITIGYSIRRGRSIINSILCQGKSYDDIFKGCSAGYGHAEVTETTNLKKYGPIGSEGPKRYGILGLEVPSSVSIPLEGGVFRGFYGYIGMSYYGSLLIRTIGVFVAPKFPSSHSIQDLDYAPTQLKGKIRGEEGLKCLGPWGRCDGVYWAYKVNAPVMRITIGYDYYLESIICEGKSYDDISIGCSVGDNAKVTKTFDMDTSKEQLTSISLMYDEIYGITSICFQTNLKKYGPFGGQVDPPSLSVYIPLEDGVLHGFYGRMRMANEDGGSTILGIGIFVAPKFPSLHLIQDQDSAPNKQKGMITNEEGWRTLGPWGGKDGIAWAYKISSPVMHISICYGETYIESIICEGRGYDGIVIGGSRKICSPGGHGSYWSDGNWTKTFCIDASQEQLRSISLTYGDDGITSLCFDTDITRYGPFGLEMGASSETIQLEGGVFCGFHGRSSQHHITAIGIFVGPKVKSLHTFQDPDSGPTLLKGMITNEEGWRTLGPWGGKDGIAWAYKISSPVMHISICYGETYIESIMCEGRGYDGIVIGGSGKICSPGGHASFWSDGNWTKTFCIDTSQEQLRSISLTYGDDGITSLCFDTDLTRHGPFGLEMGASSETIQLEGGVFCGFHGRSSQHHVTAIGIFVGPKVNSLHTFQDPDSVPTLLKGEVTNEEGWMPLGPWGGKDGVDWACKVNDPIIHITIGYGKVIESFLCEGKSYDGIAIRSSEKIGRINGHVIETFCINSSEERLTSVSLTYDYFHEKEAITSLCFNTNINKYGPFGSARCASPVSIPIDDGVFGGFHGRTDGRCITAFGIFVAPEVTSSHSTQDPHTVPIQLEVSGSGTGSKSIPLEAPTIKSNWSLGFFKQTVKANCCGSKQRTPATNKKDDHHSRAPNPSSTIGTNLDVIDSAFQKFKLHMDVQINDAREKLKELESLGSRESDFDELEKAITNLKLQIPTIRSKRSLRFLVAKSKANFCGYKPKMLENNIIIHIAWSSPSQSSEKIRKNLDIIYSAFHNYKVHMEMQISEAREKLKELQRVGSRESNFNKLGKAIAKLNCQIPLVTEEDDPHGRALSPTSRMIRSDLIILETALAEAESVHHMKEKILQAREKFNELQTLPSSERVSDKKELRKAVTKLKVQIPSHKKTHSANSNTLLRNWDNNNINGTDDEMMHFFHKEPEVKPTGDCDGIVKAFNALREPLRDCLLCFFKFPGRVQIKRTPMICLWIAQGYISHYLNSEAYVWDVEVHAGKIFDEFIAKGFIEPIYQKCLLEPDSCMMRSSVRSSLYKEAKRRGFTSNGNLNLETASLCGGDLSGNSCLVNVGQAIINFRPEIYKNMKHIRSLYLGRWQSSVTHHIELTDAKILYGLNKLNNLTFLSLRGISMIIELPSFILELKKLMILDVRACHNLEVIPDKIGLLKSLTHLDMSECYNLENMPKSLAKLSNLQVLKGFLIGDVNNSKESCTLHYLLELKKLRKLNIHVSVDSVEDLQRLQDFEHLERFGGLKKLTITWGRLQARPEAIEEAFSLATVPPRLQKLKLQCFPLRTLPDWLMPGKLKELKELYIIGGQLHDLGKRQQEKWTVEILRLEYLSEIELHWGELRTAFPKLIYLYQSGCPKFMSFPCNDKGVWINKMDINTHVQLQKYIKTIRLISSSSMLDSGSASA